VKGKKVAVLKATTEAEIDAAFAQLHVDALSVSSNPFFWSRRAEIVALAARYAVPAIYDYRGWVAAGGLISYGANANAFIPQAGIYAGKILQGAKPPTCRSSSQPNSSWSSISRPPNPSASLCRPRSSPAPMR
jgi:putative tryptophan/tyrosine transport system substrate-binding protein